MTYWADNIKFIKDVLDSKYKKIEDSLADVSDIYGIFSIFPLFTCELETYSIICQCKNDPLLFTFLCSQ